MLLHVLHNPSFLIFISMLGPSLFCSNVDDIKDKTTLLLILSYTITKIIKGMSYQNKLGDHLSTVVQSCTLG